MHSSYIISFLYLAVGVVTLPATITPPAPGLRLVKTSDTDAGRWVTEGEKFSRFIAKRIPFIDVTETFDLDSVGAAARAGQSGTFPSKPAHQSEAKPLLPMLSVANIRAGLTTYTSFYNRYYLSTYGKQASEWLSNAIKEAVTTNPKITVEMVKNPFKQSSIIARIPGTGTGVVVASAHLDSITKAKSPSAKAPGADDDGSGTFTILEALRVLSACHFAPNNTLEFHWYAGEEGGLLGSRKIMHDYASRGVQVKALLNQDMTGYSPHNRLAVIQDRVSAPLSAFVEKCAEAYTDIPVVTTRCGYACSDHVSATEAGYPAAFVIEDTVTSPYAHSAKDTMATLNFAHIMEHAKLTLGFMVEGAYF